MTIKEVEERTGLSRSNIRFYEKENLITPVRNENNRYREYSEQDIVSIKKIAFLRTLNISLQEIKEIMVHKVELKEILRNQYQRLDTQIEELVNAKSICEQMLEKNELHIDNLEVEQFTGNMKGYWNKNKKVFQFDSVSFLYMWGGFLTWGLLTVLCFLIAVCVYSNLPVKIPVQWKEGKVSSSVAKEFIFAYPVSCFFIRFILKPFIKNWLQINAPYSELITNYITNFMCFVALSIEIFTILYINGILEHITVILFVDAIVFITLLILGWSRLDKQRVN